MRSMPQRSPMNLAGIRNRISSPASNSRFVGTLTTRRGFHESKAASTAANVWGLVGVDLLVGQASSVSLLSKKPGVSINRCQAGSLARGGVQTKLNQQPVRVKRSSQQTDWRVDLDGSGESGQQIRLKPALEWAANALDSQSQAPQAAKHPNCHDQNICVRCPI